MLIVIHVYFSTWKEIILHQIPTITLRSGFHTSWRINYTLKSSVTDTELISETETEPRVSCENFPFVFHRYSVKVTSNRDHRCLVWDFLLTSIPDLPHCIHLPCLVSLCINPNSIKAHMPVSC